jgi:hypothetical protein
MADLPLEGRVVETKEIPLTLEQRVDALTKDVQELARGINTQARLLETIVVASDSIVKKYLELINAGKSNEETPEK